MLAAPEEAVAVEAADPGRFKRTILRVAKRLPLVAWSSALTGLFPCRTDRRGGANSKAGLEDCTFAVRTTCPRAPPGCRKTLRWQSLLQLLAYCCGCTLAVSSKVSQCMARHKNETLTLRTTAEVKDLLRQAADREHRSLASMVEVLVLDYSRRVGIAPSPSGDPKG